MEESDLALKGEKNPDQDKINTIRKTVHNEEKRIRAKYTWLKYQDEIGMAWFVGCSAMMLITAYFFIQGQLAWYWAVPLMAFAASILHELEHDIIHDLYFKEHPWIQHIMFGVIWASKLSSNPWWRKAMHLKHHKVSGQVTDIEERLIGLGMPLGIKRALITITPLATIFVIFDIARDCKLHNSKPFLHVWYSYALNMPVLIPAHMGFVALFFSAYFPEWVATLVWNFNVLMFFPSIFRQTSLQLISAACHYYGDIPEKNVFYQNQILNHWSCYPFQLFCFNFGETHIIHHFVTRQPFYLRQMVTPGVLGEFIKQGCRLNDLRILARANRYNLDYDPTVAEQKINKSAMAAAS